MPKNTYFIKENFPKIEEIRYLETRNLTVHSYEANVLVEVWKVLPEFLKDLEYLITKIEVEISK